MGVIKIPLYINDSFISVLIKNIIEKKTIKNTGKYKKICFLKINKKRTIQYKKLIYGK